MQAHAFDFWRNECIFIWSGSPAIRSTNNGAVNERKTEMNENDAAVEPTDFWYIDSKYHIHCEAYIEYHKDAMDWDLVSRYQVLSEPFIEKFADRVNWKNIFQYQDLSDAFRAKWRHKLDE